MKKSMMKFIICIISFSLLITLFTGFSSAKKATSKESVTLTILANQDWANKPYMKRAWQNYEEKTGNKLDIQIVPIDSGESVMQTRFATGEFPDIFMHFGGNSLAPYQPDKNFVNMSNEKWVSDLKAFALPQATFNKKVYGLPLWEGSVSGILYNKKMFKKSGIKTPTTEKEFLAACETLKKNNITPIYMGFKDVWPIFPQFGMDVITKNPSVLDKLNTNKLKYANITEFINMLSFYKNLAVKGYLGKKFSTNTFDGQAKALGEEKYAMAYCWDTYLTTDLDTKYPGKSKDFGIMPIFSGVNNTGSYEGPNACLQFVCKNGKNVEAAKEYLRFMAQPENLNIAYKGEQTQTYFKSVTTNIPSPQYVEAKKSVDSLITASTAWARIIGFDQVEMVKPMQDLMLGNLSVAETAKAMDDVRIGSAKAQKAPGF